VRFILKHASERFISKKRDFLGLAEFAGSIPARVKVLVASVMQPKAV